MKFSKTAYIILLVIFFSNNAFPNDNRQDARETLKNLSNDIPELNEILNISVTNVSLEEFIRAIANSSGLNLSVEPGLNIEVVNNFAGVKVADILSFLIDQHKLKLSVIGNIFTISAQGPGELLISGVWYDPDQELVSFDYRDQPLIEVAREITKATGYNVILSPGLQLRNVNGYIRYQSFGRALEKLCFSNGLVLEKTDDDFFIIKQDERNLTERNDHSPGINHSNNQSRIIRTEEDYLLNIELNGTDFIDINAVNAPIREIIKGVSEKMGVNYFITSDIKELASINLINSGYTDFLNNLLTGTKYSLKLVDGIYLIGDITDKNYGEVRVFPFRNRTVDNILEFIPAVFLEGLEIIEFPEQNSLVAEGSQLRLTELEQFVNRIDVVVPVVLIEVMIVDQRKSFTISTGIEAALGEAPVETKGKIFPGIDMQLGSQSINNLLNSFNGFGSVNIGKVTPEFYLSIKALEDQGILNVRSTPKLSSLNGHEASLSIGSTEYYLEEQQNIIGTQNPQVTVTQTYKPVTAELLVRIKPIVSGGDQITLEIEVEQSDFTGRISPFAPPGTVTRKFTSMIRIRNEEMILLGGLEEKRISDSGTGMPLLSRIPVIKWFFSSRSHSRGSTKLNIFIKPIILN